MSPRPQYLRLRRLVHDSLLRFSDLASTTFTEETEKALLMALSQVLRKVKQWIDEVDSDEELLADTACDGECSIDATANLDNRHCLAVIIGDLMSLLAVNSQYARHLVGKTLVAIFEFLLASDDEWDDFMQLLCLCLQLAICNILESSSTSAFETRYLDFSPSSTSSLKLKLKLKSANWSVVSAISQIIRDIQKCMKQDFEEKCMKTYLDSVSSLLINLPWDLLREIYLEDKCMKGSVKDVILQPKVFRLREMNTFFGCCIQLLCSLVSQIKYLDVELGSPIIWKFINLVPSLILWCQVEVKSPHHVRISRYFRHKVLMLMVKLSSTVCIGKTTSNIWIHLLHKYFADLLLQPISGGKIDQDGFLEGSPFCTSMSDQEKLSIPSSHLQRLAILLFLKCLHNLVTIGGSPDEQKHMHENPKQYNSSDLNSDSATELHKWLQSHVPADILLKDELYSERCVSFTSSFIQLFMHEDDILFEVLLQLLHMPFSQEHMITEDKPFAEVKNHLSADLFNPIHLFHLFLAEISYDHQVLLDYLISKDTGSRCAEYLLRSLRIVCNSWSLFVEFPGVKGGDPDQLRLKRRKVLVDCRDFKGGIYQESLEEGDEGHAYDNTSCLNFKLPFMDARNCLASLTTSIESLSKKGLFPYSPQVLLRRLMKFQELWFEQ